MATKNKKALSQTLFVKTQLKVPVKETNCVYITISGDFEYKFFKTSFEKLSPSENKSLQISYDLKEDLITVLDYIYDNWSSLTSEKYNYCVINEKFLEYHFKNVNFKVLKFVVQQNISYLVSGLNMPSAEGEAVKQEEVATLDAYFN